MRQLASQTSGRLWLARIAGVATVLVGWAFLTIWQPHAGDDAPVTAGAPVVTGAPILTASGGDPFAWVVTVSPGEDGQLCAHGAFGPEAGDRTGEPCAVVVGPDEALHDVFGSGGSTSHEGRTLGWGLVDPDVTRVEVELADGSTEIATVAVGGKADDPGRVALWAFATEGGIEATVARTGRGTVVRLGPGPVPDDS